MSTSASTCSTLPELIHFRASLSPGSTAFITGEKSYSFAWLLESATHFATQLKLEHVEIKETVIVMVPNSAAFFTALYGCMFCGAIAVPIFPGAGPDRFVQVAGLCNSRHLILPENLTDQRKIDIQNRASSNNLRIHRVKNTLSRHPVSKFPPVSPNDVAFIQFTSGSSDFPKGVPLTHQQLLINIQQMVERMKITADDVFVSWLPVYHDMGLILNTMAPLYSGAILVLLSEGLHRIHSWLKAIEKHRGTIISAPDFAYRLCVKGTKNPVQYDLSSLRIALNASESIHYKTYQLFEAAFNLKRIMISGYGLAEATVAVTIHPPSYPPKVDENGYVSSGKPLNGIDIRIEKENNLPVKMKTGEILVKSPALMKGYFSKGKTAHPFDKNGYLRTGDLGYIDEEGYLFVLARKKNIIKQAGFTLYSDDVEQSVISLEGIRKVAALGIERIPGGGESLFIFAESRYFKSYQNVMYHDLVVNIVQRVYDHFGLRPGKVYILKPKTLPNTPNGKLQHAVLKNNYLNNSEVIRKNILYPDF
jgi:acyl-CoA synthetase (AMP-forming)/AMP-acid ligase II